MTNDINANKIPLTVTPDNRRVELRPVQPPTPDGNAVPEGGKDVPQKSTPQVPEIDLDKALERLNEYIRSSSRDLRFQVDEGSGRTVITVVNAATDEVVRQIPAEEVLAMARRLREQGIQLFSESV